MIDQGIHPFELAFFSFTMGVIIGIALICIILVIREDKEIQRIIEE